MSWACVVRYGGIGDNLIAGSALRPLKRQGYKCEFICAEPHHVVMLNNPFIDKLTVKRPDKELPQNDLNAWQLWHEGRRNEYEVFAHLSHSVEGRHAVFKAMTSFWWPPDYRRRLCAGSYLETAMDIVGVPHEFGPLYFPTQEERKRADTTIASYGRGKRVIGWILSGSRVDKVYPFSPDVICRLILDLDVTVMMIGAGGKQFSMAKLIQDRVFSLIGRDAPITLALTPDEKPDLVAEYVWDVRRSLALAHRCDLIVTPDTGFGWATAFEQMPKVVLLSHASEENITKHWVNTITLHADPDRVPCWPCHRLHDDPSTCVAWTDGVSSAAACMADLSVERVVEAVKGALNGLSRNSFRPSGNNGRDVCASSPSLEEAA